MGGIEVARQNGKSRTFSPGEAVVVVRTSDGTHVWRGVVRSVSHELPHRPAFYDVPDLADVGSELTLAFDGRVQEAWFDSQTS